MQYVLYQVRKECRREYGYMDFALRTEVFGTEAVDLSVYEETYRGDVDLEMNAALDYLFRVFNIEHPKDFTSYSMSVGDILLLDNIWWYCDSTGWIPIETTNQP